MEQKKVKHLTQEEWNSISDILELVQLRAINDREFLSMLEKNQHVFTPEFLELRFKEKV